MTYNNEKLDRRAQNFEEVEAAHAGKRCALDWAPWMGDWFVSSSPRNGNSNAATSSHAQRRLRRCMLNAPRRQVPVRWYRSPPWARWKWSFRCPR